VCKSYFVSIPRTKLCRYIKNDYLEVVVLRERRRGGFREMSLIFYKGERGSKRAKKVSKLFIH